MDWKSELAAQLEYGKKVLMDHGQLTKMFVLYTPEGQMVVAAPSDTDEEKQQTYNLVKFMCVAYNAHALSCVAEAWMKAEFKKGGETEDEFFKRAHRVRPSQSEDCKEVVLAHVAWRENGEKRGLFTAPEILRDWDGKITGLAEAPVVEGIVGDIPAILPRNEYPPAVREAAMRLLQRMKVVK